VTASFGVAEYTPELRPDQLVAAADGALYRAKHAGKDQVVRHGAGGVSTLSTE
jgi:PleD family two-component response regulator